MMLKGHPSVTGDWPESQGCAEVWTQQARESTRPWSSPWTRLPHLPGLPAQHPGGAECYSPGTFMPTACFWPGLCHLVRLGGLR